jgi:competence protein CoiA
MQIYAFDIQGTLIPVTQAHRGNIYRCPECGERVQPRGGRFRRLHFYHLKSTSCRLHSKSLTHLHIQYALQQMLAPETTLLEHRFPQIGRVADVVWPAQRLIFEVQVSPISSAEVRQRNRDYQRIGYQVIWILHDRQFNRSHITAAEIQLRFSPHYFTNMSALGKGIFYDQYAVIRFKRRVKRSRPFPVRFKQVMPVNLKQLPRQFPVERKKWQLSFEGDLAFRRFTWEEGKRQRPSWVQRLFHLYQIFLHLLLEKTTY